VSSPPGSVEECPLSFRGSESVGVAVPVLSFLIQCETYAFPLSLFSFLPEHQKRLPMNMNCSQRLFALFFLLCVKRQSHPPFFSFFLLYAPCATNGTLQAPRFCPLLFFFPWCNWHVLFFHWHGGQKGDERKVTYILSPPFASRAGGWLLPPLFAFLRRKRCVTTRWLFVNPERRYAHNPSSYSPCSRSERRVVR